MSFFLFACFWFQCVLWSPVNPGSSSGAGEQRVPVARSSQPVQSARHLLLVFSHGDVHQGPGVTDRSTAGQFVSSAAAFSSTKFEFSLITPFPYGAIATEK